MGRLAKGVHGLSSTNKKGPARRRRSLSYEDGTSIGLPEIWTRAVLALLLQQVGGQSRKAPPSRRVDTKARLAIALQMRSFEQGPFARVAVEGMESSRRGILAASYHMSSRGLPGLNRLTHLLLLHARGCLVALTE